ncbi:hypothetical protein [Rubritalea tangerina]|uniref:HTTM domain-containing protein n=1 Tax=Rubritalea tangerina TaxID=430798 RepID=A0ABW4Z9K9_9BACT
MNAFLEHCIRGQLSPHEGSLYSKVAWLWLSLLQLAVAVTFAARGWLMYRWDSHIRGLIWNEEAVAPLLAKVSDVSWEDFALESDPYITGGIEFLGIALMVGAFLTLLMRIPYFAIFKWALIPLWAIVALDSYSNFFDVHYQEGMLIEYALQVGLPLLFLWVLVFPRQLVAWGWVACCLASMCFIGHGLYAVGHHPVPWLFQNMTMEILGVGESAAKGWLYLMGVLDFIVAIGVLVPWLRKPSLVYMVFWGGVTSIARVLAHYEPAEKFYGMDPWVAEMFVRCSHWLVPLLVLMLLPLKSQNGRLTLSLLEISSQTRRVLSKATILHK